MNKQRYSIESNEMKSITVGITGASGSIYAQNLLMRLNECPDVARIDLVITKAGVRVVGEELGINVAGTEPRVIREIIGIESDKFSLHPAADIGATIASGSYLSDAMVIVPCSMSSLACIATGIARDLVHRAADVMMKENRPLIIVPRETPLHAIHLENMLKLARMGVRIVPAMPSFYHFPKTINDLVEHFTYRLLDHLGIAHEQKTRWEGSRKKIQDAGY
ncbi:MAG: UbiX family flavin prenyltransferase [Acidobacteria bacterium]|nr:UbiX family flavin prenyltransferase [Acidobacteriota bacterium]